MKGFFRHGRAIKHSVGSEDAVGETVGSECTCILYLHTVLPRASPGPRKGMIPLTSNKKKHKTKKKKKKKWGKERSISPNS